jgi:hypothetical protein
LNFAFVRDRHVAHAPRDDPPVPLRVEGVAIPQKIKDQKLKIKMTDKNAKMFLFY